MGLVTKYPAGLGILIDIRGIRGKVGEDGGVEGGEDGVAGGVGLIG